MGLRDYVVGFVGGGAMGGALIKRLVSDEKIAPQYLYLHEPDTKRALALAAETGINLVDSNEELVRACHIVVFAVKPQLVPEVFPSLRECWSKGQVLISIAAGVTTARIREYLPDDVDLVRVMPNAPALIGEGVAAVALEPGGSIQSEELTLELFHAAGSAVAVSEDMMDAATGVSGSGPAYVYLFIEALADAGVREGLPRQTAMELAAYTVLGGARMVLETGKHPGELKDMVTSPGGTTIAGVARLEARGFRGTVMEAVRAAAGRGRELGGREG